MDYGLDYVREIPHIYFDRGMWLCLMRGVKISALIGDGDSPLDAFNDWKRRKENFYNAF